MIYLATYLTGVIIALTMMRDAWRARVPVALLWPLGPVAFVVVISMLVVAAIILWPLLMLPVVALVGALGWWWLA